MPSENSVELSNTPDPSGSFRLHELDAIRGLAALSVVFMHFHDMWVPDPGKLRLWQRAILGGLRFFYSGGEAVITFFVLSGLVLALPYLRKKEQSYPTYVVRRILRIVGPYLIALGLAVAGDAIWHNHAYHGQWAAAFWPDPLDARSIAEQALLVVSYDPRYLFVSWTLLQEMRISIIFPFVVGICLEIAPVYQLLTAVICSILAALLMLGQPAGGVASNLLTTMHFVSFFVLGIILAGNLSRLRIFWNRTSRSVHYLILAVSIAAQMLDWTIDRYINRLIPWSVGHIVEGIGLSNWIAACASVGWIVIGINALPARKLLSTTFAQFLGRISFSLYLLHPTILLALTFACPLSVAWWIQFPIYLTLAIGLSWVFYWAVEQPFIRWGRLVKF